MIKRHRRHFKEETKKVFDYAPLIVAIILFGVMIGGIIYILVTGGIYSYIENKKIKELTGTENSTSAIVSDMLSNEEISCENKDKILEEINNIKISYGQEKISEGSFVDDLGRIQEAYYNVTKIYLTGLDDLVYAKTTNSYNDDIQTNYSINNVIAIEGPTDQSVVTYYIRLYAKDPSCGTQEIKAFSVELPMVNIYYDAPMCENYRDKLTYCMPFAWELYHESLVERKVAEYESLVKGSTTTTTKQLTEEDKKEEKQKNYTITLCVCAIVVIITGGVIYTGIMKRKENK